MNSRIRTNPARGIFGFMALILFAVFAVNVVVAKLSVVNQWGLPRVPGVIEFLVLFFATGCFVAYTASSHKSDSTGPQDPSTR